MSRVLYLFLALLLTSCALTKQKAKYPIKRNGSIEYVTSKGLGSGIAFVEIDSLLSTVTFYSPFGQEIAEIIRVEDSITIDMKDHYFPRYCITDTLKTELIDIPITYGTLFSIIIGERPHFSKESLLILDKKFNKKGNLEKITIKEPFYLKLSKNKNGYFYKIIFRFKKEYISILY